MKDRYDYTIEDYYYRKMIDDRLNEALSSKVSGMDKFESLLNDAKN